MPFLINHKKHDGTILETIVPENLQFTLNKKAVHTIQYEYSHARGDVAPSIDGDFVAAYRTDFDLLWTHPYLVDPVPIFSGMHTPAPDTKNGQYFTTIYGKDWKHYLERRHFPFDPRDGHVLDYAVGSPAQGLAMEYLATDVTVIAKALLDGTLGRPYSLDITYPTLTTGLGIPVDFQLAVGDTSNILSFIDTLSDIDPGFDYEIDHFKELRFYSPHKYDIAVVDDPSFASYVFTDATSPFLYIDGPSFLNNGPAATHWLATGSGINQSRMGVALGYEDAQIVFRRLDGTADYGNMKKLADMRNRAMRDFSFALNPQHEITFVTTPAIDPVNFWTMFMPGEPIWISKDLGSHVIDSAQEIVKMDCVADDTGDCQVTFGLNQIYAGTTGVDQA